jgi:AraC-like DNA-binding protein
MNNSITILSYVGLSQAVFSAFLFYTKGSKRTHDRILILWLLTIAFRFLLIATEQIHGEFFDAEFSIGLVPFTFGPFLFLYTKYLINPRKQFSPPEALHFAPFLILVSIYFLVFKDRFILKAFAFSISISTLFLVTSVIYTALVFWYLRKFRKTIRPNIFSYDTTSNRLFWLNYISVIFLITYVIYFITKFYSAFSGGDSAGLETIPSIGLMIMTYSVSYFAIKQPNLFKDETELEEDEGLYRRKVSDAIVNLKQEEQNPFAATIQEQQQPVSATVAENLKQQQEVPATDIPSAKQEPQELSPEKAKQLQKLQQYMLASKPFLNPELTLQDLSVKLNIPKHQLTMLFNNYLGKNFFEYINEYRIQETKQRILEPAYEHLTLVAIAYECGFNSKSTFNTFFKHATGLTPTEWRKKNATNTTKPQGEE